MNKTMELQKKMLALYRKVVGEEVTHVSVMLGQGWITYVRSRPAALTLADMDRQVPDTYTEIEETREEIDILDDQGELVDIKLGKVTGYLITTLYREQSENHCKTQSI